jgi:hypothetical protein
VSSASRLLAVSAVALCCATAARADGDPASDFLPVQNVFTPFDTKIPQPLVGQLTALVNEANARGFKLKVAVIATTYDLGAVPSLFDKPKQYARFLGQELYLMYNGRLLIVMPNGYGLYRHGKPVPPSSACSTLCPRRERPGPHSLRRPSTRCSCSRVMRVST